MEITNQSETDNKYTIKNNKVYFKFNDERISDELKVIFQNFEFFPKRGIWAVPYLSYNYSKIFKFVEVYDFTLIEGQNNQSGVLPLKKEKSKDNTLIHTLGCDLSPNIKDGIKDYQIIGVQKMIKFKRYINGDAPGLGKTLQSIASCETLNIFPILVVSPAHLKYNWEKEWKKWTYEREVSVIENKESDNWGADVIIINYDLLSNKVIHVQRNGKKKEKGVPKFKQLEEINWKVIIADESHYLKNPKALRSQALKSIIKKIEYRFFLTGTLIKNRPSELINQLSLLGVFERVFGHFRRFVFRYCDAHQTNFGLDTSGASNLVELNMVLSENCYIRREIEDVIDELPDLQETILNFELSNLKDYKRAETNLIKYLVEEEGVEKANLALNAEHLVLISTLRSMCVDGKVKGIKKWIDNFLATTEEKLVVIGVHVDPLKKLHEEYYSDIITGETNSKNKFLKVEKFKTSKQRVFFGNIESIGVGTDGLQEVCSNMLIIDLPDTWSDIEQVVGRLKRLNQKNFINIYFGLSKNSIDDRVWKILQSKKFITDAVNKGQVNEVKSPDVMLIELLKSYL